MRAPWRALLRPSRHVVRERCARGCAGASRSNGHDSSSSTPGFVFDIDGVLLRGDSALPAGREAMRRLYEARAQRFRVPVMFLTNGGGVDEAAKAARLSERLGVRIPAELVVLSHTPMRALAHKLNAMRGHCVVCVGRRHCVDVARSYGFQRAYAIEDIALRDPASSPHTAPECADGVDGADRAAAKEGGGRHGGASVADDAQLSLPVAAVLVMHDSRNWGRDIQLVCDLAGSDGGAERAPPSPPNSQPVKVYSSNSDFVYVNEHPLPRFSQGAFFSALRAVFRRRYGRALRYRSFGKPQRSQFAFTLSLLRQQLPAFGRERLSNVYMVGDNPEADVRGANAAGRPWVSVLVRSGCFQGGENDEKDRADVVVDDALQAVEFGLKDGCPER